jgi:thioesterase domain-containing protein
MENNELFTDIKIATEMGIKSIKYDLEGNRYTISVPLDPNRNDKGTFFAGSIYSVMVLSGWGAVTLFADSLSLGGKVSVVIATSTIDYLSPISGDVDSIARIVSELDISLLKAEFNKKNRLKFSVEVDLFSNEVLCAKFTGLYVAKFA